VNLIIEKQTVAHSRQWVYNKDGGKIVSVEEARELLDSGEWAATPELNFEKKEKPAVKTRKAKQDTEESAEAEAGAEEKPEED
jgi:hypothetical protein